MIFMWQILIEFLLCQALLSALNEMDKFPYEAYFLLGERTENKQNKM